METIKTDILVVSMNNSSASQESPGKSGLDRPLPGISHPLTRATERFIQTWSDWLREGAVHFPGFDYGGFQNILGFFTGKGAAFRNIALHRLENEDAQIWRFPDFDWQAVNLIHQLGQRIEFIVCPWYIEMKQFVWLLEMVDDLEAGLLLFDQTLHLYLPAVLQVQNT